MEAEIWIALMLKLPKTIRITQNDHNRRSKKEWHCRYRRRYLDHFWQYAFALGNGQLTRQDFTHWE
jgi:serine/threonine protein kinase HipA of HipAB toxin-antitoxin module